MLGGPITAEIALLSGLVTRVVPKADVLEAAQKLATQLANGPNLALGMTKRMLNGELSMDLSTAIESEAVAQALLLRAEDHRSFYEAYVKGEKAHFQGR